eukprot:scaffold2385_cov81-Skeletonema_marinoi.AAC.2
MKAATIIRVWMLYLWVRLRRVFGVWSRPAVPTPLRFGPVPSRRPLWLGFKGRCPTGRCPTGRIPGCPKNNEHYYLSYPTLSMRAIPY